MLNIFIYTKSLIIIYSKEFIPMLSIMEQVEVEEKDYIQNYYYYTENSIDLNTINQDYKDNIKHFCITNNSNVSFGNAEYLFYNLSNLESIDFNNASFSNVTSMLWMFNGYRTWYWLFDSGENINDVVYKI